LIGISFMAKDFEPNFLYLLAMFTSESHLRRAQFICPYVNLVICCLAVSFFENFLYYEYNSFSIQYLVKIIYHSGVASWFLQLFPSLYRSSCNPIVSTYSYYLGDGFLFLGNDWLFLQLQGFSI
jgi:hypothetical protein